MAGAPSQAQAEDKTFEGVITGVNRGGCMVTVHGLRGFLPGSHLCNALPTEDIIGQVRCCHGASGLT